MSDNGQQQHQGVWDRLAQLQHQHRSICRAHIACGFERPRTFRDYVAHHAPDLLPLLDSAGARHSAEA